MPTKEVITGKFKSLFRGDKVIWMIVVFLTLISMLVVYTSSDTLAYREYNDDNGRVLMKDRELLVCDEKELMAKCRESAKKLWAAVNA